MSTGKSAQNVKVVYAHRCPGAFRSIEELFGSIQKSLPNWIIATQVSAPLSRATLRSLVSNTLWLRSLKSCDVIHQTGDIHYAILGEWRRPVVLTIHDLRFIEEAWGLRRWFFWWFWLYLPCLRADRVTVISEFTKSRLLALCPVKASKLRVIPNCVSTEFMVTPKIWPSDNPRLLLIGTTENKNLERVLAACVGLPVRLAILGILTPAQRAILNQAKIDYEQHFNLSQAQVVALYASCDAVVFASTYEGFGMPILEAQAVGRPVVTSDRSPMREVAGGAAILVDPLQAASIRAGIQRLLDEPNLRDALVHQGFKNVKRYSAESVASQYAALYHELGPDL